MVANRDVENFAEEDVGRFLDNTWNLMPETNPALRTRAAYTIVEYRTAIQKIEGFLSFLNPNNVFHDYKRSVAPEELERMRQRAATNLQISASYLRVKLLSVAILEALAEVTGGNAPMALFMGDVPREGARARRLEDHLPGAEGDEPEADALDPVVANLLELGRASESSFDMKGSPLSAFLYRRLGHNATMNATENAKRMFRSEISPEQFLDLMDPDTLSRVAEAASHLAITRKAELSEISRRYGSRP
jgi:hypothetical protein